MSLNSCDSNVTKHLPKGWLINPNKKQRPLANKFLRAMQAYSQYATTLIVKENCYLQPQSLKSRSSIFFDSLGIGDPWTSLGHSAWPSVSANTQTSILWVRHKPTSCNGSCPEAMAFSLSLGLSYPNDPVELPFSKTDNLAKEESLYLDVSLRVLDSWPSRYSCALNPFSKAAICFTGPKLNLYA